MVYLSKLRNQQYYTINKICAKVLNSANKFFQTVVFRYAGDITPCFAVPFDFGMLHELDGAVYINIGGKHIHSFPVGEVNYIQPFFSWARGYASTETFIVKDVGNGI